MKDHIDVLSNESNASFFSANALSTLYALGHNLYQNGKYHQAKEFFQLLLIADPSDRRYWMGLGASLQLLKNYDEALACYGIAAIQKPDDPYPHRYAAECFFNLNRPNEGLQALDSALSVVDSSNYRLAKELLLMQDAWKNYAQEKGVLKK